MTPVEQVKNYLRVDHTEDDELLTGLIGVAEKLCRDIARIGTRKSTTKEMDMAMLYATAYLYEHREEADYKELTLTLRALLFGVREEQF